MCLSVANPVVSAIYLCPTYILHTFTKWIDCMHKRFCRLALVLKPLVFRLPVLGLLILASQSSLAQTPALSEPALSPDGKEIAFVSGGDIWVVPSSGGEAHLLVSDPATESRPLYSPDGK